MIRGDYSVLLSLHRLELNVMTGTRRLLSTWCGIAGRWDRLFLRRGAPCLCLSAGGVHHGHSATQRQRIPPQRSDSKGRCESRSPGSGVLVGSVPSVAGRTPAALTDLGSG
jgi:hypothetical protein